MWLDQWNIGDTNKGWEVMWLDQWNIGDTNKGGEVMWLDYNGILVTQIKGGISNVVGLVSGILATQKDFRRKIIRTGETYIVGETQIFGKISGRTSQMFIVHNRIEES